MPCVTKFASLGCPKRQCWSFHRSYSNTFSGPLVLSTHPCMWHCMIPMPCLQQPPCIHACITVARTQHTCSIHSGSHIWVHQSYRKLHAHMDIHTCAYMGALQVELYRDVLRSKSVAALMSGRASEPSEGVLGIITTLRKLCNHPDLLHSSSGDMHCSSSVSGTEAALQPPTCFSSGNMHCSLVY